MSQLNEALSRLADIHTHLARTEVYRGLTAKPVILSGVLGLLAAVMQPQIIGNPDALSFVTYWLGAAALCAIVGVSTAIYSYFHEKDAFARRRAQAVSGQFLPCLAAGLFLTLALLPVLDRCVGLLPGLWAILYALGLFAARPFLPHATGWVAFYFLMSGTLLINLLPMSLLPSPWSIAGVFALGQFGLAWVLYRNSVREIGLV